MVGSDLRFLDPADVSARQAWDEAVANAANATIFHTTAWMDVIRNGLGLTPRFVYLAGTHGSIRALVPLFSAGGWVRPIRWLNVPQSCSSDPLAPDDADAVRLLAQLAAVAADEGAAALLLRTPRALAAAMPEGWEVRREQPMARHVLDLSGAKDALTLPRIQPKLRQKLRSGSRRLASRGVSVRIASRQEIHTFTRQAHRILLRRHGHLGMPVRFFEALFEFLPNATRLVLAGRQGEAPLGFSVSAWGPTHYQGLYGACLRSKEAFEAFRLILTKEIEAAIALGLPSIDLGESAVDLPGVLQFKESLGGERVDGSYLVMARKGARSGLRDMGSQRIAVMQRLLRLVPVGLSLRIAGPVHRRCSDPDLLHARELHTCASVLARRIPVSCAPPLARAAFGQCRLALGRVRGA